MALQVSFMPSVESWLNTFCKSQRSYKFKQNWLTPGWSELQIARNAQGKLDAKFLVHFVILNNCICSTYDKTASWLFFKKWANHGLFLFIFCSFLITISIQIEKSVDGVLGIRTRGRRMVGTDETTELWRPPDSWLFEWLILCKDILYLKIKPNLPDLT